MTRARPVVCTEPAARLCADDVLALALSMLRGREFGPRSQEVKLVRLALRQAGFEICRVEGE